MFCWCLKNETKKFKLGLDLVEVDPKDMTMDACGRPSDMTRYLAVDIPPDFQGSDFGPLEQFRHFRENIDGPLMCAKSDPLLHTRRGTKLLPKRWRQIRVVCFVED